jgi:hypothetical protein
MASGLELRVDLKGGSGVAEHFNRAGDSVRAAVAGVLADVGQEVASAAASAVPAKRARGSIYYRVIDGAANKGTGRIRLIVNTRRSVRWVQQFEFGTVGTGPDAKRGEVDMGVRAHMRRVRSRDRQAMSLRGGKWRRQTIAGFVQVRSYTHKFHMPERPFMGPAFSAVRSSIVPRIEAAVDAALAFDKGGPT